MVNDNEVMTDDPLRARTIKAVSHEKVNIVRASGLNSDTNTSGSDVFISSGANCFWHVWGLGQVPFVEHRHISKSYPKSEDTLVREAMDAFYNANEVDSLLNAVEAPQLVTGIQPLFKLLSGFKNVGNLTRRQIQSKLKTAPKKGLGFISNGYLYYSFGVAPLISDMKKIGHSVSSFRRKLDAVIQNAGQKISVHRSVVGSIDGISRDGNNNWPLLYKSGPGVNGSWDAQVITLKPPTMTCTIQGFRENKYHSKAFQTLDYLASRFGSIGPASFLWERIPFSFVVDWFLDLSGVINQIDNTLTGNSKKITGGSLSQAWKVLLPIYKRQYSPTELSDNDNSQIATVELSAYYRKAIQPTVSVGLSGRFGKKQISLSAALLGQMAANLRAKR
jgi:hypothetical protein